ncbi:hypothetical protein LINPERPRIM_LOCUS27460 [Linum perenne]
MSSPNRNASNHAAATVTVPLTRHRHSPRRRRRRPRWRSRVRRSIITAEFRRLLLPRSHRTTIIPNSSAAAAAAASHYRNIDNPILNPTRVPQSVAQKVQIQQGKREGKF